MLRWVYCYDGQNLPPEFSTRICCFKPKDGSSRVILEACTLIPDLQNAGETFGPLDKIWVIRGDIKKAQVFPWAWLKIETEVDQDFFTILQDKGTIVYTTDHLPKELAKIVRPPSAF